MMKSIALICALSYLPVAHGIVNLDDIHTGTLPDGVGGKLEFAVSGDSGNTEKSSVSLGGRLHNQRGLITDVALLNYSYGESQGSKDTDKGFLHLRHIHGTTPRFAWEAFAQVQNNLFSRLSLRTLLGAGIRMQLVPVESAHSAVFGLGGFYEEEELEDEVGTSDSGEHHTLRGNVYLFLQLKLNEQTRLFSTTYYQPDVDDFEDYRVLEQAGLKVRVAESLDLKLSLDISYDNQPAETIEKEDIHYLTGFEYSF